MAFYGPYQQQGAPANGGGGSFAGVANIGAELVDLVSGIRYVNTGTISNVVWSAITGGGATTTHTHALSGGATDVTATPAEVNTLAGVTAGTAAASKAVVLDASGQVSGLKRKVTAASADGAIAISDGIVKIRKGSAAALTLADPAAGDEGTELLITAQTAFTHTVSNAAGSGFNAGGAASDVATFGGAVGDCLHLVAINATWNVVSLRNVTLA